MVNLFNFFYNIGDKVVTTSQRPTRPAVAGVVTPAKAPTKKPLTHAVGVVQAASEMIAAHPELRGANAIMAGAMAMVESGGNTLNLNPRATRFEPVFLATYIKGKAAEAYGRTVGYTAAQLATSYGIGQVMLQSAIELWRRGYKGEGFPSPTSLKDPRVGLYFMLAAQADIVKRSGKTAEAFVVQSYNGGIGQNNTKTQNHLKKYIVSKATLAKALGSVA